MFYTDLDRLDQYISLDSYYFVIWFSVNMLPLYKAVVQILVVFDAYFSYVFDAFYTFWGRKHQITANTLLICLRLF